MLGLLLFGEAFNKVMKPSVSIQKGQQCAFMSLSALLFQRSCSVNSWTQTNTDILFYRDSMYLHPLTNELVRDTNSPSINELPKVATALNNVEYCRFKLQSFLSRAH